MTQSPSLPELPKLPDPARIRSVGWGHVVDYEADQMNAHYLKGYEAGRASRAQSEPEGWRSALQFYAERSHFAIADDSAWDTVSGEPANFWCDEAGTATVEDGTVAAMALAGTPLPDDEDAAPTQGAEGVAPQAGATE